MASFVHTILAMPRAAKLIAASCAAALIFVGVMQYGFGLKPCVLCIWQRVPYAAAFVVASVAAIHTIRPYARFLLNFCGLIFLTGMGLAVFHTGVERHWWLGTSGCSIQPLSGGSTEDLRTQLLHTAVARCDEIVWTFQGLSMANYNVAGSLLLALFAFAAARRIKS